jgi:hypothetical protein
MQIVLAGALVFLLVAGLSSDPKEDGPVQTSATGAVEDDLPFAAPTSTTAEVIRTTTTVAPTTAVAPTTTTTAAPTTTTAAPTTTQAPPPPPPTTAAAMPARSNSCHPSYDPCVPSASDVDCAGGSGNGPAYTGTVRVIGPDEYDLDRDGDGIGSE